MDQLADLTSSAGSEIFPENEEFSARYCPTDRVRFTIDLFG